MQITKITNPTFKEKHMKKLLLITTIGLTLALSGCVISVDGDGRDEYHSDWQDTEQKNRKSIANLQPLLSKEQVSDRLGAPDFSEFFAKDGDQYYVLYFRTQRKESDGITTKDECTPLVLRNGVLVGWGDSAYAILNQ
ncbi:MAG: outer membrane protein assembly factor BamE (lipoprotein component of BamABCDE complex) [Paraglaciecola sp.]|jgi:outer membrane protein assembly factor BamE (lipoprotein component of BamABCDE complex)